MDDQQQCLEPLLQITGSINIWLSTLLSTRALSIRFRFKAQSYKTTMFLNILKRGLVPPQKSYELKPIIRIVHTTSMQKSLTSFKIHSLPTNNSVDKQWTRYGQSVPISQIRKLIKKGLDTNHLMESLPFVLTPSTTKYEYWKRHTKKS